MHSAPVLFISGPMSGLGHFRRGLDLQQVSSCWLCGDTITITKIVVLQAGGFVHGQDPSSKDFSSFYCTGDGCGRADKDVPAMPYSSAISDTKVNSDGST